MVWHLKQYLRRKLWSRVWRGVVGRKNAGWSIVWATFRNEIAYHLGKWEISTDSDYHCSSNFYCSGLTLSRPKSDQNIIFSFYYEGTIKLMSKENYNTKFWK